MIIFIALITISAIIGAGIGLGLLSFLTGE